MYLCKKNKRFLKYRYALQLQLSDPYYRNNTEFIP
jgi:hypothetical protein